MRGLARGGAVSIERAAEAVSDLARMRLVRYPHSPLRDRIWELRDNLTAYDATYVALADALDASVLMTADQGVASTARPVLGLARVTHVA